MIAILLLGILACAEAAPRPSAINGQVGDRQFKSSFGKFSSLTDEIIDTQQFKEEMRHEIADINKRIDEISSLLTSPRPTEGIEGDQFVVRMSLKGYNEKDIFVRIEEGALIVKAAHDTGNANKYSFLTIKRLPDYVSIDGDWVIKDDTLKVMLPMKNNAALMTTSTVSSVNNHKELDKNDADTDV